MLWKSPRQTSRYVIGLVALPAAVGVVTAASLGIRGAGPPPEVAGVPVPRNSPAVGVRGLNDRSGASLAWRLNNPAPNLVPETRANPAAIPDKFAARERSMTQRGSLRAYEGAPPVIPHSIAYLNVQTCRACHAQGLQAGDKVARMVSHTYLTNCTQCHVSASEFALGDGESPMNGFQGLRSGGHGGTRASAGAPPVIPHTTFMRTNCTSCHGEHGYDGWRPDHLSRTNCVQCHVAAAELDQLAPGFGVADVPDGRIPAPPR